MEQIIERIKRGHFWKFHGGIHPPEQKFLTNDKPIRTLATPTELILPLQQHIGHAGKLLVKVGDKVLKGQPLTSSKSPMSVPIHAPTSGEISKIESATIAHPSGMKELCVFLTPDGEDIWQPRKVCQDYQQLTTSELVEKIANAGISGMGGAGFPTHIKVSSRKKINYLIINAAECEPYISADDLLIREHSPSIIDGINILDKIITPDHILIGIEDNKPKAIKALQQATKDLDKVQVCVLPTKYPTGGEKQLIQILTGQEVPSGVLPSSLGIVMQNVGTCFAIADAVINDIPLIKRVVTVTGQALNKPQNVWALIGTPVDYLLTQCGYQQQHSQQLIMGGPMMGFSLPSLQVPVIKTSNCILVPSTKEIPTTQSEVECIRCGQCAEVCPSQLLPQELQWSAKAKDQKQLNSLNLFDCIECGACAYVCPSQIPLVHYYRIAKAEIREQQQADLKADQAKKRFEARKVRLEKEKQAREEKHRKAAEARKARMNSGTADANKEKSAVAAALARVKAKKLQGSAPANEEAGSPTEVASEKSQVSAAIARAKAKKLAAQQLKEQTQNTAKTDNENSAKENVVEKSSASPASNNATDDKKAKVAAAIAKAKAKKLAAKNAEQPENTDVTKQTQEQVQDTDVKAEAAKTEVVKAKTVENKPDDKKAKIAAAIAKAKAKKLAAKKAEQPENTDVTKQTQEQVQDTDAKAEAAKTEVVKAEALETKAFENKPDDKKAKIAAAIAKAKAKKLAASKTQDNIAETSDQAEAKAVEEKSAPNEQASIDDAKKKRIAAAVAKAKAKKQQRESI